ncbi:AMP-binding protein [Apilactobacillus quenuiae]|uniref:AMP-binding protein n=1 Tax=Apilactobacillus quenuiae TaxID=2008377 RepID=UPI000D017AA0|nr:non-ribosomal peptide synthetase [Apilactobacillus quenuiae]
MNNLLAIIKKIPKASQYVIEDNQKFDVAELVIEAEHLAQTLVNIKDKYILINAESNTKTLKLILAIWLAGKCYVPINKHASNTTKSSIAQILSSSTEISLSSNNDLMVNNKLMPLEKTNVLPPFDSNNGAYIIFTSGTTGKPKGVEIKHKNLYMLLQGLTPTFKQTSQKVWINLHSFEFDFSIWEIFAPLCYGDNLVLLGDKVKPFEFDKITNLIDIHHVNVINQTPSVFMNFYPYLDKINLGKIDHILFGGEKLDYNKLKAIYKKYKHQISFFNLYGITEVTIHATIHKITDIDFDNSNSSNIGKGLFKDNVYLVNDKGLRSEASGEIVVAGPTVAFGYLNNVKATMHHFDFLQTTYYSGDFGKYDKHGNIQYLYRKDSQVEVNGHRVELSGIETIIETHTELKMVKCIFLTGHIYCFYVASSFSPQQLALFRQTLENFLETYMMPHKFIRLNSFPTNKNGKIDEEKLQNIILYPRSVKSLKQHNDEFDNFLINYLNLKNLFENYNRKRSFMELGLSSVDLIDLCSELNDMFKFNPALTVVDLFQYQSIDEFKSKHSIIGKE